MGLKTFLRLFGIFLMILGAYKVYNKEDSKSVGGWEILCITGISFIIMSFYPQKVETYMNKSVLKPIMSILK